MSGGLTDRDGTPFGNWQYRFMDWFRNLGFLQKPGVKTKAAEDITVFMSQPATSSNSNGTAPSITSGKR